MSLSRRLFSLACLSIPLVGLTVRPAYAATHQVAIKSMKFGPRTLEVAVGDKVTFTNHDNAPHSATAKDGAFDTGTLTQDQSATVLFDAPGEYAYFCTVHPMMKGKIIVG